MIRRAYNPQAFLAQLVEQAPDIHESRRHFFARRPDALDEALTKVMTVPSYTYVDELWTVVEIGETQVSSTLQLLQGLDTQTCDHFKDMANMHYCYLPSGIFRAEFFVTKVTTAASASTLMGDLGHPLCFRDFNQLCYYFYTLLNDTSSRLCRSESGVAFFLVPQGPTIVVTAKKKDGHWMFRCENINKEVSIGTVVLIPDY